MLIDGAEFGCNPFSEAFAPVSSRVAKASKDRNSERRRIRSILGSSALQAVCHNLSATPVDAEK